MQEAGLPCQNVICDWKANIIRGYRRKIDNLEEFFPDRVSNRILGMGDVVSLVEKAKETIDADKANKIAKKISKGLFDLDDMAQQLKQMSKMGGISEFLECSQE